MKTICIFLSILLIPCLSFSQPDTLTTPSFDMDFCVRHDALNDRREGIVDTLENNWSKTTFYSLYIFVTYFQLFFLQ